MERNQFDIAILGAGPVGLALANTLLRVAPESVKIALFQGNLSFIAPEEDTRVLALNYGSQVFLEKYGVWPDRSADIKTVHVSQKNRLGRTLISHEELGVPRLGSMVAYAYLHHSLGKRLEHSRLTILEGGLASAEPDPQGGVIVTQGAQQYHVRLAVQCDGLRPSDIQRQYNQHALITSATVRYPQPTWAWERFTADGPLAILPHPIFAGAQSIVWATPPAKAQALLALSDREFERALEDHFGDRLGSFKLVEQRVDIPLHLSVSTHIVQPSLVVIGNAAQTMHPVAGQGLNLGLRDVATLDNCLHPWLSDVKQDVQPFLEEYAKRRRIDRRITWELTDFLPRVFTTKNPLVEHACGLGLLSLDLFKPLRSPLTHQLLQGFRR